MGTSNNLQQRLDAYVVGDCNPRVLADELLAHCAAAPRASWEVLALLDQYHRRGKLPHELHRAISQSIQRRALGVDFNESAANAADAGAAGGLRSASNSNDGVTAGIAAAAVAAVAADNAAPAPAPAPAATPRDEAQPAVDELASREILRLRKELQASRSLAAAYLEQLKSVSWQRPVADVGALEAGDAGAYVAPVAATAPAANAASAARVAPVARVAGRPRVRVPSRRPSRWVLAVAAAALLLALATAPRLGERDAPFHLRPPKLVHVPVPGRVSLESDTFLVQPGEHSAQVTVLRTDGADGETSFLWWTRSAGAKAGVDFRTQAATRVAMPDGVKSLRLTVPILANPARRHTEMFYVEIGKPQGGATLGEQKSAAVFIMRP